MNENVIVLMGIFEDWSEQDLEAALEEAHGDLSLCVSRISEGQVDKWVTAKQEKKKQNPQATVTQAQPRKRGTSSGRRGGRGRGRGGYQRSSQRPDPVENPSQSQKVQVKKLDRHDKDLNDKPEVATEKPASKVAETDAEDLVEFEKLSLDNKPKSNWAAIVKSSEPEVEQSKKSRKIKPKKDESESETVGSSRKSPEAGAQISSPSPTAESIKSHNSPAAATKSPAKPLYSSPKLENNVEAVPSTTNSDATSVPPGLTQKNRKNKQNQGVILPAGATPAGGVQFGSLNVAKGEQTPATSLEDKESNISNGAPGLYNHYQQHHFGVHNIGAMPDYSYNHVNFEIIKHLSEEIKHDSPNSSLNGNAGPMHSLPQMGHAYNPYAYAPYYMAGHAGYQPYYGQQFGELPGMHGSPMVPHGNQKNLYGFQGQPSSSPNQTGNKNSHNNVGLTSGLSNMNYQNHMYGHPGAQSFYSNNATYEEFNSPGKPYGGGFGQHHLTQSQPKPDYKSQGGRGHRVNSQGGFTGQQNGHMQPGHQNYQPLMPHQQQYQLQYVQQSQQNGRGSQQGYWNGN